jgi:hypothetical protein
MQTHIITRQIGIAMLAFCATFLQTTLLATSDSGGAANSAAVHVTDARVAVGGDMVSEKSQARRG